MLTDRKSLRWSRESPIDRQYFKAELVDGQIITVVRDRHADKWVEQDYTQPADIGVDGVSDQR